MTAARALIDRLQIGELCDQYRALRDQRDALIADGPYNAEAVADLYDDLDALETRIARFLIDAAGAADRPRPPALTDTQAIEWIARMLRAPEWDSACDYIEEVAEVIGRTGRDLEHQRDCDGCGAWPGDGCSAPPPDDHSMAKEDRRNAGIQ